ncbi:hypothetical protein [Paenibacillus agricola]|uniref:Uncharacterized protein n=1 Tax=Paenibacillus agricola TaxID=2716264 RepID=A0ABX0JHE3_9BACL|nr:hypothetical protein [Paenibacillus agricola]NHN34332.1 hypothetical protein [Paenibacillus agricola]
MKINFYMYDKHLAMMASGVRSIALDQDTVDILKEHHQRTQADKEKHQAYRDSGLAVRTPQEC